MKTVIVYFCDCPTGEHAETVSDEIKKIICPLCGQIMKIKKIE